MERTNEKQRVHIEWFNPDVQNVKAAYQDFSFQIRTFDAGVQYKNFNEFLMDEAIEYSDCGDGVTYVVWNIQYDDCQKEISRELVSFYTMATTAIPYEDRIRLEPYEAAEMGREFDTEICGIPAVEIKMFAVNQRYQDVFFTYDNEDLPVAAWVLKHIIDTIYNMSKNLIGCKAIFLHSVPDAVDFYLKNGFHVMEINMQPFHSMDSEFTAMYLPLYEIHMNFDK